MPVHHCMLLGLHHPPPTVRQMSLISDCWSRNQPTYWFQYQSVWQISMNKYAGPSSPTTAKNARAYALLAILNMGAHACLVYHCNGLAAIFLLGLSASAALQQRRSGHPAAALGSKATLQAHPTAAPAPSKGLALSTIPEAAWL
jgi:hypothetical protein